MRTLIAVAGLAFILCAAPAAVLAQRSDMQFQPLPNTTPLAITVTPAPVPKGEALHFVTITLTNTSDGVVRFPMPAIGCDDTATGYVALLTARVQAAPACSQTSATTLPDRKKWTVLQPGETANFGQMVTPLLPKGAGTFEVRAMYTPPTLPSAQQEELYRDSVVYPKEPLTSAPAQIIRETE
jgi:hypothetical protein